MAILILTPIKTEYQSVRKHLSNLQAISKDNCNYEIGTFKGIHQTFQIVIRQTGAKNTTIALATEKAIQHFQPSVLLLVGIAGGIKDVVIGDVVVATKAYGYAVGKETEEGYVARPHVLPFSVELLALAERIEQQQKWQQRIGSNHQNPAVYFAPIASDDKVVATTNSTTHTIIKKHFNDAAALDMEAIGFAEASFQYPLLKALVIRGISDLLNNKTDTDGEGSQELAVAAASAFAFELIYQLDLSQLKLPTMKLQELTEEVSQYIQPNLDQIIGKSVELPTNPQQSLIWKKIKPCIAEEIKELQEDPTDAFVLTSIPVIIRKFLKNNNFLQQEIITLIGQIQNSDANNSNDSSSTTVFYKSPISAKGDLQIGSNTTTTNYHGSIDKQWNIEKNSGDFNFDHSTTNHIKQQVQSPKNVNDQYNISGNQGSIYISEVINIGQVLESSPTVIATKTTLQKIHELIRNNKIKQTLEHLLQLTQNGDRDEHNQVILLTNRWNRLKQSRHAGTLSTENGNIEQNRIVASLLNFVEEL